MTSAIASPSERPASVTLETSLGTIELELYWNEAPAACNNLVQLADSEYYNGVIFHRVIKDFMAQTGDPTGTGRGGKSIYGAPFADECTPALRHTGAGVVSMANAGANSNTSQFFITLAPTPWLDGKHTIFGRVKSGMKVVRNLGLVVTDKKDRPVDEVKVFRAYSGPPRAKSKRKSDALVALVE